MGLFIRTIGIKRAEAAISWPIPAFAGTGMACNMKLWCWLEGRCVPP